jgi:hypothetical protein
VISAIYVEDRGGRLVTEAINRCRPNLHLHAELPAHLRTPRQRAQRGDECWIRDVGGRDIAILRQDRAIPMEIRKSLFDGAAWS